MFGVSRSTVREAIKLLIAENVVEIQRGKGTFVTLQPGLSKDPLGLEFANQKKLLDNLMETRMMIEPQIAYLAAQRATQANIDKLADIIEKFKQLEATKEIILLMMLLFIKRLLNALKMMCCIGFCRLYANQFRKATLKQPMFPAAMKERLKATLIFSSHCE